MMANQAITEWVAKDILEIPFNWMKISEGTNQLIELLPTDLSSLDERNGWFARNYFMFGQFCTHHLWFLYDLIYLTLGFVIFAWAFKFLPNLGLNKWLAESPLQLLWLIPITYFAQLYMGNGDDGVFGPSTAVFLQPDWIKLGYYAVFFGYGAI